MREWQDLVAQLRQAAREVGVERNQAPAEPGEIHTALLSGLLSHVGVKDAAGREYLGARGARFAIFPGSRLARRPPDWVMVAELVETGRLWGRTAARIDPAWIEPLAEPLLRRSYAEPRWSRKRAQVVATERATLYGLPVVAGRTVAYGAIDPALARELFVRKALVEGDWNADHAFLEHNRRLIEDVQALEERARRRDLLVSDQVRFDFYEARVPADVVSGAHFDRWWRDERRRDAARLDFTRELLVAPDAAGALGTGGRPGAWKQGELVLDLSYRFEPGAPHDGVTAIVPLKLLPQLRPEGFDWLVPAFRLELVTALIRTLPKDVRRALVPVPELAAEVLARLRPRRGPLVAAIARELEAQRGVRVAPEAFDPGRLPDHLRMSFRVQDETGRVVAEGTDLEALRERARPRLRQALAAAARPLERHGMRGWELEELPRTVALPGTGATVRAYPALVDEGETAGVRVLDTPGAQAAAMRAGTRRLLLLTIASPLKRVQAGLGSAASLALAAARNLVPVHVKEVPVRTLACTVAAAALLLAAPVALAHQGNPNYRSVVKSVTPETSGIDARILNFDDAVLVHNTSGKDVVILDYKQKPYVELKADGTVSVNTNSEAHYLNEDRQGETAVPKDLGSEPKWEEISKSGRYEWHDHRMHWMGAGDPPNLTDKGKETVIYDNWQIPIQVAGTAGAISGTLTWVPLDDGGLPLGAIFGFAALIIVLSIAVIIVRRRRASGGGDGTPGAPDEKKEPVEAW